MNKNIDDNELRQFLKDGRQEAPEHPFFKRKVMNRLPESKGKNYSGLMWAVYIAVLLVCAGFWTDFGLTTYLNFLQFSPSPEKILTDPHTFGYLALLGVTIFTVWQMFRHASECDK